jgi:hypothetical protein
MLLRIWLDQMDPDQFEDLSNAMQILHKPMKNVIEIVFASSPLLALSTHGWASQMYHSTYLLRVSDVRIFFSWSLLTMKKIFLALGNDRPEILIRIEDRILEAILNISKGKRLDEAVGDLYSQIVALEDNLADDNVAMRWFSLPKPPGQQEISIRDAHFPNPSTPLPLDYTVRTMATVPNPFKKKFQGSLSTFSS